ncbi:DNA-binding transcriptional LysR family regulator [Bradyrhizobium sp. i1.3.6]
MLEKHLLKIWKAYPMDRLEAMSVIVAVTETGSFSAASRRLNTPVATVSRTVAELEARLKAQLFQRSSRQMKLTDVGRSYIEACKRIIGQVDDAEREVSGEYRIPKGDLAVTSPWGLGHMHLLPIALEFMDAFPDIALRLVLTDRIVNTAEENIDISVRIGNLPDSNLIATRVGSVRFVLCASPSYVAKHGQPKVPADLAAHDCISIDSLAAQRNWKFVIDGREVAVPIPVEIDFERLRGCGRSRDRGCRHHPRHVVQDGSRTARRKARFDAGTIRTGAMAGAYRLRGAQARATQAQIFSRLGHAAP